MRTNGARWEKVVHQGKDVIIPSSRKKPIIGKSDPRWGKVTNCRKKKKKEREKKKTKELNQKKKSPV